MKLSGLNKRIKMGHLDVPTLHDVLGVTAV